MDRKAKILLIAVICTIGIILASSCRASKEAPEAGFYGRTATTSFVKKNLPMDE